MSSLVASSHNTFDCKLHFREVCAFVFRTEDFTQAISLQSIGDRVWYYSRIKIGELREEFDQAFQQHVQHIQAVVGRNQKAIHKAIHSAASRCSILMLSEGEVHQILAYCMLNQRVASRVVHTCKAWWQPFGGTPRKVMQQVVRRVVLHVCPAAGFIQTQTYSHLRELELKECNKLVELLLHQANVPKLEAVVLTRCSNLLRLDLGDTPVERLVVRRCRRLQLCDLGKHGKLRLCLLRGLDALCAVVGLSRSRLRWLHVQQCELLQEIDLQQQSALQILTVDNYPYVQSMVLHRMQDCRELRELFVRSNLAHALPVECLPKLAMLTSAGQRPSSELQLPSLLQELRVSDWDVLTSIHATRPLQVVCVKCVQLPNLRRIAFNVLSACRAFTIALCPWVSIDEIGQMIQLRKLKLVGSVQATMPPSLASLQHLRKLEVVGSLQVHFNSADHPYLASVHINRCA